ncbi:MAG: hypothetical protein ACI9XZ_004195 [Alphaproteobacteria bacterium]|jgi:hypothetical protein
MLSLEAEQRGFPVHLNTLLSLPPARNLGQVPDCSMVSTSEEIYHRPSLALPQHCREQQICTLFPKSSENMNLLLLRSDLTSSYLFTWELRHGYPFQNEL